jgi:glycine/D-amino acid oxidase-like deaminating enzyme
MTDETEKRDLFDDDCAKRFQQLAQDCMLDHPELRNVSVVFCWKGGLNDSPTVSKGLWIGDSGVVSDLPGIFGGLFQSLKMVDEQAARAFQFVQKMREEAQVLGHEIVRRQQELQSLKGTDSGSEEATSEGEAEAPTA